jgi:hypothetical protein
MQSDFDYTKELYKLHKKIKKESKNDWESTNINIISCYVLPMLWSSFNNTRQE